MRIKVQIGEEKSIRKTNPFRKFIYVIDSPATKTIDDLIRALQEYIAQQFSFTKTEIVELKTEDGYVLSKSDRCVDVLQDNDRIVCIDMQKFINEYYSKLADVLIWFDLQQHDASDDQVKSIRLGLNNFSELFVRMFGILNVAVLHVFGIHELIKIAEEKRKNHLIARLDSSSGYDQSSTADWFMEVKWEYDTVSNKDLFIISNLKVASNDEVWSNKLHIILDTSHMRIEKGEVTRLSGETNDGKVLTDQQRERLRELVSKLPPPKRTGPQINLTTNDHLKLSKHECEGESSIRMACGNTNTVDTYQDKQMLDDGTFAQNFALTHIIFSKKPLVLPEILQQKRSAPADKPVSVVNLTVFYQMHDGGWRECRDVAIAPIAVRNEQPKWLTDTVINIEPDKLISFTIQGWIPIKGEPGGSKEVSERMHKSLPQPLKLKIVITDNFAKQCSLIIEHLNKPFELDTRESFFKNNQSSIIEMLAFVYADNCEADERVWLAMYISKDNQLVLKTFDISYITFNRKALRMMEYNAKQNKTTEVLLKQVEYRWYAQANRAFALFDPESYMFYAVRLEVSTKTSKTEETVFVPLEMIK